MRDFPDLFLDQVRKFYLGSDDVHPLAKEEFESYRAYFDRYGHGEEGWRTYARRNYLEGSLVDEAGHIIFLTAVAVRSLQPDIFLHMRDPKTPLKHWSS